MKSLPSWTKENLQKTVYLSFSCSFFAPRFLNSGLRYFYTISSYQLIDCFPIINMNRRLQVPLADGRVVHDDSNRDEEKQTLQGAFFPFEPYLLSHSGVFINGNNSYLDYEGRLEHWDCLSQDYRRANNRECIILQCFFFNPYFS